MVHIHLSIRNLEIVPGRNLTLPTKEQDYGSLWHSTCFLHNDKFYDWYTSPNVIWVKKMTKVRLSVYIARVGEEMCVQSFGGKI
jgi:hypothetical protein